MRHCVRLRLEPKHKRTHGNVKAAARTGKEGPVAAKLGTDIHLVIPGASKLVGSKPRKEGGHFIQVTGRHATKPTISQA